MPQVFQVLKCYKCSVFQIHQTKKSNKFECKMCGEKQSIKRHYGIGTGKDCRMHVQKLNILRGNMDIKAASEIDSGDEYEDGIINKEIKESINLSQTVPNKRSKWSSFIDKDKEKEEEITDEPMFLGDKEVFLELPRKSRNTKFKVKSKSSYLENDSTSINRHIEGEFNGSLEVAYKNNVRNFESEDSPVSATETISQEKLLNNVNDVVTNKLLTLSPKPVVLQSVNKNSRWAQYVNAEDAEADTQTDVDAGSQTDVDAGSQSDVFLNHDSQADNLFSLCDDNDLDEVLDI